MKCRRQKPLTIAPPPELLGCRLSGRALEGLGLMRDAGRSSEILGDRKRQRIAGNVGFLLTGYSDEEGRAMRLVAEGKPARALLTRGECFEDRMT
jgi:hypothetical protein